MRMLALAQAWRRRGGETTFASAECPPALIDRIANEGFKFEKISCDSPGDQHDALATIAASSEWIILDGYHFNQAFQQTCQSAHRKLLCVDDYGHCKNWHCDLVLNQNLGAPLQPNYPKSSLLGLSYALLRQEFLNTPRNIKEWGPLQNVLITLGGADPPNATQWILEKLAKIGRKDLQIRVLVGPANPHKDSLYSLELPFQVEWKESVTDMPAEYAWADGVISAGGSSCWEWLYFGLPGAVVTIADNQEPVVNELEKARLALCLGWPDQNDIFSDLSTWLDQPAKLINQSAAFCLIDGRGADRVVAEIDGTNCLIRQTDPISDAQFTFDLVNHPSVRSAGYSTDPIPWQTHCDWLLRHHTSPDSFLFIIETADNQAVGFLRFQRSEAAWEIGIALTTDARGRGFADQGIRLGMTELAVIHEIRNFRATIRPTNSASKNLFQRLEFNHISTEGDRETWTYLLP